MKNRKTKKAIKKAIIDRRDKNIAQIIALAEANMDREYFENNIRCIEIGNDPIGDKWRLNVIRDVNAEIDCAEEEIKRYFSLIDRKES